MIHSNSHLQSPATATFNGVPLEFHKFTVEQYFAMGEHGILTREDRVELLDGWIVDMYPIGPSPATAIFNDVPLEFHKFTVEQYFAMGEHGILEPDMRTELLDGWIVDMSPIGPGHAFITGKFTEWLIRTLPPSLFVQSQQPLLFDRNAPQPDLQIIRGQRDDYRDKHPVAADIAVVIEVSDSTLAKDRKIKGSLYATAGIAEYWIVNLAERVIDIYRNPKPANPPAYAGYSQHTVLKLGTKHSLVIDGLACGELVVDAIL